MNNKFMGWIEAKLLPLANKVQRNKYLQVIQAAFMTCMPIMLVGSIVIILTRPWADYTAMTPSDFGYVFFYGWQTFIDNFGAPLLVLRSMTLYSLSLWITVAISYHLAVRYKLDAIITPIVVLLQFFVLSTTKTADGGLSNDWWGGEGLFAAIVIGILVTELYRFFVEKKIGIIQMPEMVPPALKKSFASIFPVIFTTAICSVISIIFQCGFKIVFPAAILALFHPFVLAIDNVFGLAISSVLSQIVWWFGIHNTAVTSMLEPLMYANLATNSSAYAAGTAATALPTIWTESLWWNFMVTGGSGATLAAAFLLLRSKSKQIKTVGKLAVIPALFNINEPIIFGLPIVLNPLFLIPFICAQTINGVATYLCMDFGLVNRTFVYPGWNIPTPIAQFLATMDWRAVVLALVLLVVDGLIYYPFLKVWEHQKLEEENTEKTGGEEA